MASPVEMVTVNIPHQPLKGFRREVEENPKSVETNENRIRREMKSLQDRVTAHYLQHVGEREKGRMALLTNLNQLDLYWFELDWFDKKMFRFRSAWTNYVVDDVIQQLSISTADTLKDLWSMQFEIEELIVRLTKSVKMDAVSKRANYKVHDSDPTSEYIIQTMISLRTELDKLEWLVAKKREAHRLSTGLWDVLPNPFVVSQTINSDDLDFRREKDLKMIKESLQKEKVNNGVNILISHFNNKVIHSLRAANEYNQNSAAHYQKWARDVEYICSELADRLILDDSMPGYEKAIIGNELNQFRIDANAHIQEVDNFNYELRELLRGAQLKKLRGLTKEEFKERIHDIIRFIEGAEVPLRIFKSVGFVLKNVEEVSANTLPDEDGYGQLEKDYFD